MTEIELLVDFFKENERQGPGSANDTLRALEFIDVSKHANLKIADIGCGCGGQTFTLAANINGEITAIDLFPEFLNQLEIKAKKLGLEKKIKTIEKSMEELPFSTNELDIIWSEGAIYNIGFENGIKKWKNYLKVGGYLAISEITWITNSRPKEIEDFWNIEYPEIDTASNKIKLLEENDYTPVGYFILPQKSWLESFYEPMKNLFPVFLKKYNYSELVKNFVTTQEEEIGLYNKFKDFYSYGFYIAKKN